MRRYVFPDKNFFDCFAERAPGQISPPVIIAKQDAVYERMRAGAEQHGVVLLKINHP